MVATISPREAARRISESAGELIDVRMPPEFEEVHAQGARLIPLNELDASKLNDKGCVYLICKMGQRARKACEKLQAAGRSDVWCVEGGTTAWEQAGLPVVRGGRKHMSLERQVRIAAGSLVLIGAVLGFVVHPLLHWLSALIGAGLVFAGITDFCGMAMLLAKMPWNRVGGVACH